MKLVHQLREVGTVNDLPARAFGKGEVIGKLCVGQHDDVVPPRPRECPPRVALDVVTEGVARFTGLTDRFDVHVPAASDLAPAGAVVPHLAALDFEADDAGALDGDDEVDLMILEVISNALPRNDEVVGLKLLDQRLVDVALGPVGEAPSFGWSDRHASSTTTASTSIRSSATAIPRLNNVWMTTVGQTRDRNSCRWPGLRTASQRESRGLPAVAG
jgi:hypothetical protein